MLKKLPLTESVIVQCEQSGFLAKFLTTVVALKTEASIRAGAAFVERIGAISWQPSLNILTDSGTLSETTCAYGRSMLRHVTKQCEASESIQSLPLVPGLSKSA
jgi:hypothetical protein